MSIANEVKDLEQLRASEADTGSSFAKRPIAPVAERAPWRKPNEVTKLLEDLASGISAL